MIYVKNEQGTLVEKSSNADGELSAEQKKKLANIMIFRYGASAVGMLTGLVFAYNKKSCFWCYIGFAILGSLFFGGIAQLATLPATAKIVRASIKEESKTAEKKQK